MTTETAEEIARYWAEEIIDMAEAKRLADEFDADWEEVAVLYKETRWL